MNIEEEKKKIALFIKTGLVVLCIILAIGIFSKSIKKVITVSSTQVIPTSITICIESNEFVTK